MIDLSLYRTFATIKWPIAPFTLNTVYNKGLNNMTKSEKLYFRHIETISINNH